MMINNSMLDELLNMWKTERAPRPDTFSSEDCFERTLLTKLNAEEAKRTRKQQSFSMPQVLKEIFDFYTQKQGLSVPQALKELSREFGFGNFQREAYVLHDCISYDCCMPKYKCNLDMMSEQPYDTAPVFDTEEYKTVGERPFVAVSTNPLSTFGADVDTAMYADLRRMVLEEERLPPPEAVRLEEMVNYFEYSYPAPQGDEVMRPSFELGKAPWDPDRQLLLIGVQAKTPEREKLPPSHYVFLIDNSGSMDSVFPMVKEAMTTLAGQLRPGDKVSLITYGGCVNVLLEGSSDIEKVCEEIIRLEADGCTPGGEGIQKAYAVAEKHFIKGGNNRIVLITDGDFNVGASSEAELIEMVKAKRDTGIYLSIAGCGMGNYKDNKIKMLANQGNGNAFYLDTVREAKRVFVHGMTGNMYALARDVKFQVEFNPAKVFAYRLLGYELRDMTDRDFRDDNKESGTVGLGQQVTILYELIPADASEEVKAAAVPEAPPLKYVRTDAANDSNELLTFRMRWRETQGNGAAKENTVAVTSVPPAGENLGWAATVAEAALALRESRFASKASLDHAAEEALKYTGKDAEEDEKRAEFLLLLRRAFNLRSR